MIRRPPRSTRTDTLSLHDALPIARNIFKPWMLLPMTGGKGINGGLVLQRGTYHVQPFNKHMLMPVGQGKLGLATVTTHRHGLYVDADFSCRRLAGVSHNGLNLRLA